MSERAPHPDCPVCTSDDGGAREREPWKSDNGRQAYEVGLDLAALDDPTGVIADAIDLLATWQPDDAPTSPPSEDGAVLYTSHCGHCGAIEGTVDPNEACNGSPHDSPHPHQFGVFALAPTDTETAEAVACAHCQHSEAAHQGKMTNYQRGCLHPDCDCAAYLAPPKPSKGAREALEAVQEDVCGLLCPNVKKTHEDWTHVPKCQAITAALASQPSEEEKP